MKTLAVAVLTRGQTVLHEGEQRKIERLTWRGTNRLLYLEGVTEPVALPGGAPIDVIDPEALQEVWG